MCHQNMCYKHEYSHSCLQEVWILFSNLLQLPFRATDIMITTGTLGSLIWVSDCHCICVIKWTVISVVFWWCLKRTDRAILPWSLQPALCLNCGLLACDNMCEWFADVSEYFASCTFRIHIYLEDGGSRFFGNIDSLSRLYNITSQKTTLKSSWPLNC